MIILCQCFVTKKCSHSNFLERIVISNSFLPAYFDSGADETKAWTVDGDGNYTLSEGTPEKFTLEFLERSKFLIRASNGRLLEGKQHGEMRATGVGPSKSTLWEF